MLIVGGGQAGLSAAARLNHLGVDTLIVWPVLPDKDERKEQLRLVAELASE